MASRRCVFCTSTIEAVDYKNTKLLSRYVNAYSKIETRKRSGNCAKHQRMIASAIKRSRVASLMPFTTR